MSVGYDILHNNLSNTLNICVSHLKQGIVQDFEHGRCEPTLGGPSLSPPLYSPYLFPSPSRPHIPTPSPPSLRSRPLKSNYEVWAALQAAPAGPGAEPQPKLNLFYAEFGNM